MGIEYIVDLACPVKDALSVNRMISLIKGQVQANAILTLAEQSGDQRPLNEIRFVFELQRPEGIVEQELSVQSLLDDAEELKSYQHHCVGCPANVLNQPFGCYTSICYPILAETEEGLMSLLPDDLNSTAGKFLNSIVEDFKYTGSAFAEMRKQDIFFERKEPVKYQWGEGKDSWDITSDQVLQMIFGLGSLLPTHCATLALILGIIPHEIALEKIPDMAACKAILAQAQVKFQAGEEQLYDLVNFLNAVKVAAMLEVKLGVDL